VTARGAATGGGGHGDGGGVREAADSVPRGRNGGRRSRGAAAGDKAGDRAGGFDRADRSRARFTDLLAAEWIKLRSLRSTYWAFCVSVVAVVGLGVNAAYADVRIGGTQHPGGEEGFHLGGVFDAFGQGSVMVMMLAMGAIGAIAVVGEYSTGLIRVTFSAVPARRSVMTAKLAVVTGVAAVFGAVVALLSFGVTQWILSSHYVPVSLGDPGVGRVAVATALTAPLSALVGMAIGTLLRQTAVTVVATVAVLLLVPALTSDRHRLTADLDHALPLKAWLRLTRVFPGSEAHVSFPWSAGGAWTVYAVWAAVSAALVVGTVHRRDQ
jgi:ABC-2 type transport system permease protein